MTTSPEETAQTRSFLQGMAGEGYDEQFTVGQPDDIVREVETLVATGVDSLIFNMPLSSAETVAAAGDVLLSNFA